MVIVFLSAVWVRVPCADTSIMDTTAICSYPSACLSEMTLENRCSMQIDLDEFGGLRPQRFFLCCFVSFLKFFS